MLAACLAAEGIASHRAAARLWGMTAVAALKIEITVPLGRQVRLPGVRAHRSNRLDDHFVTTVDGVPVTTPARTLVDLSAVCGPVTVEQALDDALRRGTVTLDAVERSFEDLAGRGRRRVAHLRPILQARSAVGEPADSALEDRILGWIVAAGLPEPSRQHRIPLVGRAAVVDFAYPEAKLAVEVDGWSVHQGRSAFDDDRARANEVELAGWRLLRFTSRSARPEVVAAVARGLAHPNFGHSTPA